MLCWYPKKHEKGSQITLATHAQEVSRQEYFDMNQLDSRRIAESFFSKRWSWQLDEKECCGSEVVTELSKRLPHIDPATWPARFALGGVYLAGRPASLASVVTIPSRLEYYEPIVPFERVSDFYPAFSAEMVLYADDDLGVVFKPAGLPTMPARDQQEYNLWRYLTKHFGKFVHTPSRLDTAVAGLVLCSFSSRMNRHFQRAYERKLIEKYYFAEVQGAPEWKDVKIERPIERDPRHPVLRRCSIIENAGEPAQTNMCRIGTYKTGDSARTLLQAEPVTGRTHQIRLHCMSEGFPIVGDPFYQGSESETLHLVSYAVRLFHPYKQRLMTWELPPSFWPSWLRDMHTAIGDVSIVYRKDRSAYEGDSR